MELVQLVCSVWWYTVLLLWVLPVCRWRSSLTGSVSGEFCSCLLPGTTAVLLRPQPGSHYWWVAFPSPLPCFCFSVSHFLFCHIFAFPFHSLCPFFHLTFINCMFSFIFQCFHVSMFQCFHVPRCHIPASPECSTRTVRGGTPQVCRRRETQWSLSSAKVSHHSIPLICNNLWSRFHTALISYTNLFLAVLGLPVRN